MISPRHIATHVSKQADGTVVLRLVHKPSGTEVHGKGTYETARRYCENALEYRLGDEIERASDEA